MYREIMTYRKSSEGLSAQSAASEEPFATLFGFSPRGSH